MVTKVLDDFYLGLTAIITVVYQLVFFSIAFGCKFDLLTDFAGGTNFAILAIATLSLSQDPTPRQILVTILMSVWALRLSIFLFYRILRTGHDSRFDKMRDKFFPFLGFWVFQMLWVWTVSLPVTMGNSPAVVVPQKSGGAGVAFGTAADIAGVIMFAIGFLFEVVGDWQKFAFRNKYGGGAAEVCGKGLWKYSRHPNYFGDILAQFGIYAISTSPTTSSALPSPPRAALLASIVGPLFITLLLLFVSGMPLTERPAAKRRYETDRNWDAYEQYLRRTSPLFPFPPALYSHVPVWLKRTLFLELPIYVFDPAKHSEVGRGGLNAPSEGREGEEEGEGSE
ncbi:hypothetical protein jhhlp_004503 [Lomentospora prolificans]|uniref:Steroid 5-alpha reductase C-terminal domain-containing protein n=1 Tax=Lomentospora prolificans TaxID=41688 RepID=A0A2N3NBR6_9PEZI|nr:hypothetical protein jhhlp_004503 [Lomentospora prolificans]